MVIIKAKGGRERLSKTARQRETEGSKERMRVGAEREGGKHTAIEAKL